MIAHNANVDQADNEGHTPLIAASMNGHIEVVKLLIDNNATVNQANDKGYTPLYKA